MSSGPKVIKNNESIVPFFGERMSFIRGLDPLGLQNTSDATFSLLLPGLNNVTGRIRYYSFYCWLLDEYSKRIGSTDPLEQRKFIRTAEYIIALSSQFYKGENSSIPGSNYAKNEIKHEEDQIHDLNAGIYKPDGTTANTYWNFRWGAFGQYYLGSLRDIGIIIDRESNGGVYARTNSKDNNFISGEMLAEAFAANIPNEKKELFFTCILNGRISESQLKQLLPEFDLTLIPSSSREQELLIKLLIQKDYPIRIEEEVATLRRETIKHLLDFIKSEPENFFDRQFVYAAYNTKGKKQNEIQPSLQGWYYYQFNEFWHYSNTSILNGSLDNLEATHGPNWAPLGQFIDDIADQVLNKFQQEKLVLTNADKLESVLRQMKADEYKFLGDASGSSKVEKIFNGFLIMFSLFLNNRNELITLKEYGETNDLAKDGEGSGYFVLQFIPKLNTSFKVFIRDYLFKNIIYRHQYVAFRKIRGGGLSTQKFIIEDQHIRYLGNFEAGFTGPRIGSLISFLQNLNVISIDYKLLDYGNQLLTQISSHDN